MHRNMVLSGDGFKHSFVASFECNVCDTCRSLVSCPCREGPGELGYFRLFIVATGCPLSDAPRRRLVVTGG